MKKLIVLAGILTISSVLIADHDLEQILYRGAYKASKRIAHKLDKATLSDLGEIQEMFFLDVLPELEVLEELRTLGESRSDALGRRLEATTDKTDDIMRQTVQNGLEIWKFVADTVGEWIDRIHSNISQEQLAALRDQAISEYHSLKEDIGRVDTLLQLTLEEDEPPMPQVQLGGRYPQMPSQAQPVSSGALPRMGTIPASFALERGLATPAGPIGGPMAGAPVVAPPKVAAPKKPAPPKPAPAPLKASTPTPPKPAPAPLKASTPTPPKPAPAPLKASTPTPPKPAPPKASTPTPPKPAPPPPAPPPPPSPPPPPPKP